MSLAKPPRLIPNPAAGGPRATQCGHGGDAAGFEIEAYVRYEKPASSGDGKKEKFLVKRKPHPSLLPPSS